MNTNLPLSTLVLSEKPHPRLQPFINQYVFRSIHFPQDHYVQKAMPMRISSSLDFFIGDRFETIDCRTGQPVPFERSTIRGPRTHKLYDIRLNGHFISFTIKFRFTGLYRLTGIPMHHFTDHSIPGNYLYQLPLQHIVEKLLYMEDLSDCIKIVEPYLLFLSEKSRFNTPVTEKVARKLTEEKPPLSIAQLAAENHLSLRQLERVFLKEVGVSPKTLYRMLRFDRLLQSQMNASFTKWSATAYEFGYYDQMHLIRDFRKFLGITPSAFIPADFAL